METIISVAVGLVSDLPNPFTSTARTLSILNFLEHNPPVTFLPNLLATAGSLLAVYYQVRVFLRYLLTHPSPRFHDAFGIKLISLLFPSLCARSRLASDVRR